MENKDRNESKEDPNNMDKGPLKDEHLNQYGKKDRGKKKRKRIPKKD